MDPLSEKALRASFVNCSKSEAGRLTLPDLDEVAWDRLDYLGWTDRKAPLRSYVVVPVDGAPVGLALRAPDTALVRRKALCAWCEDVYASGDTTLYVAARAGASGRAGNTVGTLVCTAFDCSRNVRRPPLLVETGEDPDDLVRRRVEALRARAARFAAEVLS